MKLLKTTLYSGLASLVRILSGFIAGKIVAVLLGPIGIGYIGQFSNLTGLLIGGCNSMWSIGTVKLSAESGKDLQQLETRVATLFKLVLLTAILVGSFVFFLSAYLSEITFDSTSYQYLFQILGTLLFVLCINQFFISLLNGRGEMKKYVLTSMVGSIFSLILTVILVYFFKLQGALISIVFGGTGLIFISIYLLHSCDWFSWRMLFQKFDKTLVKQLVGYSMIGLFTGVGLSLTQLFIRSYLAKHLSWTDAGYWQALTRLSQAYLSFLTMTLSVYFLPKFSSLLERKALQSELLRGCALIIPIMLFMTGIIYFFRYPILSLVYTQKFYVIAPLFKYQLLGDALQIVSWLFGYLLLAKTKVKTMLITEVFFCFSYCLLVVFFTSHFGLVGAVLAFLVNYFIYLLVMAFLAWHLVLKPESLLDSECK